MNTEGTGPFRNFQLDERSDVSSQFMGRLPFLMQVAYGLESLTYLSFAATNIHHDVPRLGDLR